MFFKILIAITITFIAGFRSDGEETGRRFALEVKKDHVKLINGEMSVRTSPGKLTTYFTGPFGNFGSYGFRYPLAEIKVEADTDEEKSVALISQVQHRKSKGGRSAVFTLKLTARANSPVIELRAMMKNAGEYPAYGYFYYRLVGLKFPYYYDAEGWQYAGKPAIPVTDWLFLPSANTTGGYGLIPFNRKNVKITTLYPRGDWQKVGLYFSPEKKLLNIKPGETFSMGFMIFPAISQWQVCEHFEK